MSDTPLSERLDFHGLDRTSPNAFNTVSTALDRCIEDALENFYAVVSRRRDLAAHFESSQSMSHAKSLQAEHWQAVFRDGVDERFKERALRIGNVHARIGLEPR